VAHYKDLAAGGVFPGVARIVWMAEEFGTKVTRLAAAGGI